MSTSQKTLHLAKPLTKTYKSCIYLMYTIPALQSIRVDLLLYIKVPALLYIEFRGVSR